MPRPSDLVGSAYVCKALKIDRSTLVRRIAAGRDPQPVGQLEGPAGAYIFRRVDVHAAIRGEGVLS
ncbi:hypothetical protein HJ590_12035 [Naumannella sp. ID2617S]|nr:hypothetical protein [Naumannella sp. ID2617S]